jgi:hypothetical protein
MITVIAVTSTVERKHKGSYFLLNSFRVQFAHFTTDGGLPNRTGRWAESQIVALHSQANYQNSWMDPLYDSEMNPCQNCTCEP